MKKIISQEQEGLTAEEIDQIIEAALDRTESGDVTTVEGRCEHQEREDERAVKRLCFF